MKNDRFHGLTKEEWFAFFRSKEWHAIALVLEEAADATQKEALSITLPWESFLRYQGTMQAINEFSNLEVEVSNIFPDYTMLDEPDVEEEME